MMTLALLALGFASSFYFIFVSRIIYGILKLNAIPKPAVYEKVSVVIPVRNERDTINACVASLLKQDYPKELMEIIFVDDSSTDGTPERIRDIMQLHRSVKFVSLPEDHRHKKGRKPEALTKGVEIASGTVILSTDADCSPAETWVRTMVSELQGNVVLAASVVVETDRKSFLSGLETLEFFSLVASGAGLIGAGTPIVCNGANLGFRREAFARAEGYGNNQSSCSDETIMHRIVERNLGNVVFVAHPGAKVFTRPDISARSFWSRRVRWASKEGRYENPWILFELILLFFSLAIPLGLFPVAFLKTKLFIPISIFFIGKMMLDGTALVMAALKFRESINVLHFVGAELLHIPYVVVAGLFSRFSGFNWKGRSLKK